jgi:hypothetical protein
MPEKIAFSDTGAGVGGHFVIGFGQDRNGEVYVLTNDNFGPSGSTGACSGWATRR